MADEATPEPAKDERPRNADGTFAPTEPEATQPSHPSYLVEAAEEFGFSPEEILQLSTNQLSAQLFRLQRQQNNLRVEMERNAAQPAPQAQTTATPPKDDLGLGELAETIDERFVNVLRRLDKENKELRAGLTEVHETEKRRALVSNADIFDDAFESLGKEYEKHFGTGSGVEMQKADPSYKRRMAVLQQAGLAEHDTPRIKKRKIMATASELFGVAAPAPTKDEYDQIPAPVNGAKRITKEQWDSAGVARPTSREVTELPEGEEKAVANLAKKLGVPAGSASKNHLGLL